MPLRAVAWILAENAASRRLSERLGFGPLATERVEDGAEEIRDERRLSPTP